MSVKNAKIITVTGANGGSGKTTTTLNLAGQFSKKGLKTLIIDLDLSCGAMAYLLKVEEKSDIFKILEDLNNNSFKNLEDYISAYNENIDLLSATKDPRYASKVSSKYLNVVIDKCSNVYDIILIDATNEFNSLNLTAFDLSHDILFVIDNSSTTLRTMKTIVTIFKEMNCSNYKVILNESILPYRNFFTQSEIKNIIKKNIDYVIGSSFNIKNIDKYCLEGAILTLNPIINKKHKKDVEKFEMIVNNLLKEKKGVNK